MEWCAIVTFPPSADPLTLLLFPVTITAMPYFLARLQGSSLKSTFGSYLTTTFTLSNFIFLAHATVTSKHVSSLSLILRSLSNFLLISADTASQSDSCHDHLAHSPERVAHHQHLLYTNLRALRYLCPLQRSHPSGGRGLLPDIHNSGCLAVRAFSCPGYDVRPGSRSRRCQRRSSYQFIHLYNREAKELRW